jgi:hypothetical protein
MTPVPANFFNGYSWLGRIGHCGRRGVLLFGGVILAAALVVIARARVESLANLAFDPAPYREEAARLEERAASLQRRLAALPADELLARYPRPKRPPPTIVVPEVVVPPEPTPAEILKTWRLRGVMDQGGSPVAVLNKTLVGVGDAVDGFVVKAIAETHVEIEDKEGRLHRLDLYDHLPGKKPAAAPTSR